MLPSLKSLWQRACLGLILFLPLTLLHCTQEHKTEGPPLPSSSPGNKSYAEVLVASNDLSPAEEAELIKKANSGDAPSAFRLSRFYSSTKEWYLEADRWLVVAAENGSDVAAFNLGLYYQLPYPTASLERSRHWLKIAEERGHSEAKDELQRLEKRMNEPNPPDNTSHRAPEAVTLPPEK